MLANVFGEMTITSNNQVLGMVDEVSKLKMARGKTTRKLLENLENWKTKVEICRGFSKEI